MSSRLDDVLGKLTAGTLVLDEACRIVAAAARGNRADTRYWPMLIDSRVTQQQLDAKVGNALIDAMATPEGEQTMWLMPRKRAQKFVPASQPLNASTAGGGATSCPPRPMPGTTPVLPPLELGAVLNNRYRLKAFLGHGGIGQVFDAIDLRLDQIGQCDPRVAIKVIAVDLRREPQARYALHKAVAQTKSLEHRNIVATRGVECDNERLFVVMEPLSGRWLGDLIREVRNKGIARDLAWPIIAGIAKGLSYAHEHGVVHADLSPYSVIVTPDGTPKIMGFGWGHALPTSKEAMDLLDTMTLRAYSEAYTADTWATHAATHPADDLYPLGVIAYELLAGKHPFQRHSLTTARQKKLEFAPLRDLPRRASKLIAHCLSFDRDARPQNATGFLSRMRGLALLSQVFGRRVTLKWSA